MTDTAAIPLAPNERAEPAALVPVIREAHRLTGEGATLMSCWGMGDTLATRAAWGPEQRFGYGFAERAEGRLRRVVVA